MPARPSRRPKPASKPPGSARDARKLAEAGTRNAGQARADVDELTAQLASVNALIAEFTR